MARRSGPVNPRRTAMLHEHGLAKLDVLRTAKRVRTYGFTPMPDPEAHLEGLG